MNKYAYSKVTHKNNADIFDKEKYKKELIAVDGNKVLIPFSTFDDNTYEKRILTHYTTNKALFNILNLKELRARQIRKYKSQRLCVKNKSLLDTVFSVSFSEALTEDEKMLANVKRDVQVKVTLQFKHNPSCLIDNDRPFYFYKSQFSDTPIEIFSSTHRTHKSFESTAPVFVSCRWIVDSYVSENEAMLGMLQSGEPLMEEIHIDEAAYSIIQGTGTHDLQKWDYQKEVKLIAYLQSTSLVKVKNCEWLGIPIKYDDIENIQLTFFRKNDSLFSKQNLIKLCQRLFGEKFRILS